MEVVKLIGPSIVCLLATAFNIVYFKEGWWSIFYLTLSSTMLGFCIAMSIMTQQTMKDTRELKQSIERMDRAMLDKGNWQ